MENLTSLQTLRALLMGLEGGCRIEKLKNLVNLSRSFSILRLENILSSHEAKKATMNNKKYIHELELRWGVCCIVNSKVEEEILDFL